MANFMVEHNVPFAVVDHPNLLFCEIYTDNHIAKQYASCRTKTTSMINFAIARYFQGILTG